MRAPSRGDYGLPATYIRLAWPWRHLFPEHRARIRSTVNALRARRAGNRRI